MDTPTILPPGGEGGSPWAVWPAAAAGSRPKQQQLVVVGMDLTASCREMLTWVLTKQAQPGDHIVAVHVSAFSALQQQQELRKSLEGMLSAFQGLCNLKQVKLQLEIIRGSKVKKALVEFAAKRDASKLVLGSCNKHFIIGRSASLGTYCLKRLPCTCTVVIVEHGLIVFDKQGSLKNEEPNQFHGNKPAVFSQLALPHQQDLTSFSLFMKNHMMGADQDGSCSGFTSQAAAGMSAGDTEKSLWLTPGWPLMHNAIGFDRKPVVEPVLSPTTTTTTPGVIERNLSVVNWALKLPGLRSRPNGPKKSPTKLPKGTTLVKGSHQYNPLVLGGELSSEAKFGTTSMRLSVNIDFAAAAASPSLQRNYHVPSTLAQQVECLCLDQPCTRFSYHQLKEATSNFSPSNIIGRGGASQVYKGKTPDGKLVAVKCLNQGGGHQAEEELLTDIQITCNLSHVNIVTLLGYCADTPHMALVYDYVPQGSLEDHLHGDDKRVLAWRIRYRVALGVAEALDYLQNGCRRPVIHRDVKPSNILLTENFEPRLSDFGLAKWGPTNAPHIPCNDVFGTFGYLAPEYFMYGKVNDKTDVYSFGVVLLELITGRTPIDNSRPKGQENLVTWARPLLEKRNLEKLVDPRLQVRMLYDLNEMENMVLAASLCVQPYAPRRPSMRQVLKILHGDWNEDPSILQRHEAKVSLDLDEAECTLSDKGGEGDMQTYMALAMLGVDDDVTSQGSTDLTHSNMFLEHYLEDRFSRSSSF
ncbi:unnamed protein product [Sphagnum troendelagicum]|uniref:Protein kinase domain-containing protein n=1 Tax=Sphagnum troendelagicum TaxID=128251 RepID=A0ABP0UZ57_9BRYO